MGLLYLNHFCKKPTIASYSPSLDESLVEDVKSKVSMMEGSDLLEEDETVESRVLK